MNKINTGRLLEFALKYPETEQGIACAGTALECTTVNVRGKAFFFLGTAELKVKLKDGLAEAAKLAAKEPDCCKVGVHGWVSVHIRDHPVPPTEMLERWIDESYRLLAPKGLVKTLSDAPIATGKKKGATAKVVKASTKR